MQAFKNNNTKKQTVQFMQALKNNNNKTQTEPVNLQLHATVELNR